MPVEGPGERTPICLALCSHFAAGQKEIQERNNDFGDALKKLAFANVSITYKILLFKN